MKNEIRFSVAIPLFVYNHDHYIHYIRYLFVIGVVMLLSWLASANLKRKFARYSRVPMNQSGKEVAERMLAQSGIHDVRIISMPGRLTDHYNSEDN